MTQHIEQLIDRYFDGQLSATEQTELFRAVDTDSVTRQLFDAEQFIRGSFTTDAASVPQAAMEPSASLMSKLAATKPAAQAASQQAASQQAAQQAVQETATQTASQVSSQVGSQAASQIANVAVKSTANMAGKVATTGLAAAGKTIMGLSVGAFQMVAGAVVTVAIATGVIVTTNNNTPNDQQLLVPNAQDSAAMFTIENKIDTPATPVSSIPAPMTPVTSKIDVSTTKLPGDAQQTPVVSKPTMSDVDLMGDMPPPRHNSSDTVNAKFGTKQAR